MLCKCSLLKDASSILALWFKTRIYSLNYNLLCISFFLKYTGPNNRVQGAFLFKETYIQHIPSKKLYGIGKKFVVSAFCQQMSLTDFLKLGRLCLLSNQYIWISIPIKYYFRNSCINLIVDLLLCLFWKQLFNLNSLTNLSKFDHKKI